MMLNPFPDLLVLGLLAPFILRVTLGLLFLMSGWRHATRERREGIASTLRVAWGSAGTFFIWYLAGIEILVGIALIFGFLTQIAALVGIIISAKMLFFRKRYPMIALQNVTHYVLVIAICVSLLLSGAGALAIDIPL